VNKQTAKIPTFMAYFHYAARCVAWPRDVTHSHNGNSPLE